MKIAILNDIHVGKPLKYKESIRAWSPLVENALPHLLKHIVNQHAPDVMINLGDLIRSEEKNTDLKRYSKALQCFKEINCPTIHLLGNHELKCMSLDDVESAWNQIGFHQQSYGHRDCGGLSIIWLGLQYHPQKAFSLPSQQLIWLKEILAKITQPTIICTHCPIDNQDMSGNFFYETYENTSRVQFLSFLENQFNIRTLISNHHSVKAVLQAHLHYFHLKTIDSIPYITCPAMGDNICGPSTSDHIPEIYTILTFNNERFTVKSFSREYCFAGHEWS